MNKLKHTPGPWKYTISKIHGRRQISDSKGGQICAIWNRGEEITKANALLICVAPEMLEELIKVARSQLNFSNHSIREICAMDKKTRVMKIIESVTGLSIEEVLSE